MRFAARLAGVVLLTVGLVGCDSTQIAQLDSQLATISVSVVGTDAELFNVWDLQETTDIDGTPGPDDPNVYLFCETITAGSPPVPTPRLVSVTPPWNFSVRISILRADGTEFEQISDNVYTSPVANLSPYDEQIQTGNIVSKPPLTVLDTQCAVTGTYCDIDADCTSDPADTCTSVVSRSFVWASARQLTAVNRSVLLATSNPLSDIDGQTYGFRSGLCSVSSDPGPETLAGGPQPFTVMLGKGDTIKVEARKALEPPAGVQDQFGNPLTQIEPVLVGRLAIDGINIGGLGGDSSSAPIPGDGFSFFYSSR